MKSKLPDQRLQTSCKECLFAVYGKETQTGCTADRINMFQNTPKGDIVISAYDDEKEFYVIDGLCNYFRPPAWNNGIADLEKAKHESKTKFAIVIHADNINNDNLAAVKNSLKNINYTSDKIIITISHDIAISPQEKQLVRSLFHFCIDNLKINTQINAYLREKQQDYEAFRRSQCMYFIRIGTDETIPKDIMHDIDMNINECAVRAVMFVKGGVKAILYTVFLTRFFNHLNYDVFEASIESEAKDMNLYLSLTG